MEDDKLRKRKLEGEGSKTESVPRFTIQKKTKFDKERELQERKKRIAEEEAAKVYESFVASFENEGGPSFVQAGAVAAVAPSRLTPPQVKFSTPQRAAAPQRAATPQRAAAPPPLRRPAATPTSANSSKAKAFAFAMDDEDDAPPVVEVPKKKIREMDLFLQEIKEHKFEPAPVEAVYPARDIAGSHDDGVGDTTNLYVGNLAPTITEDALKSIFEEYGPIYSVKIMWPRTEDERLRGRLSGFVCFRRRDDADDARIHLNERMVDGQEITVGWGKAVRMDPPRPAFASPATFARPPAGQFMRPPPAFAPPSAFAPPFPRPPFPGTFPAPRGAHDARPPPGRPPIAVVLPEDVDTMRYVNRFAECVAEGGIQMEDAMRLRQDPRFGFLSDPNASLYHYYKWKVLSLRRGENDYRWGHDPIVGDHGIVYLPPQPGQPSPREARSRSSSPARSPRPVRRTHRHRRSPSPHATEPASAKEAALMTGAQLAAARDKEEGRHRNQLDSDDYDDFCELLEAVSLERDAICDVMAFALDHSECAADIVAIVAKAFRIEYGADGAIVWPYAAYIARLYVVSDILHNSTAPKKNASLYRTQFEECLPEIMEVLNHVHQAIVGRMSFNAMKDKVLAVLSAWESWSLFPPTYLLGLNATFLQKKDPADAARDPRAALPAEVLALSEDRLKRKCKQAGLVSSGSTLEMYGRLAMLQRFTSVSSAADDLDGAPMDDADSQDLDGEDLDGQPLDGEDLDGEPLEDLDGEPLDDVDGEPLDD
ncbi:hypothetical protein ACHHYP_03032 [Achlya hypogyna]|uniref:U2 snRNP-associated SURP motif-containing protein n=1 Tax=Achlya hypogyna TaxID=1202772 RepID=A0A1V9Z4T0_ACHHY|nr:hypothetical protein ACHHYP_03032 [Achlya hypogyna]